MHRIVGTNFSNPEMPSIRYDSRISRPSGKARRARAGAPAAVDSINGRQEDYVVLCGGTRVGRMDHILTQRLPAAR